MKMYKSLYRLKIVGFFMQKNFKKGVDYTIL